MKLFTGWLMLAGLVSLAEAANAQVPSQMRSQVPTRVPSTYSIETPRYWRVTDMRVPLGAVPPEASRYGMNLLPPPEVDSIARQNGFALLGIPQLRGVVYTVSATDRDGDDGRLVVDARTGRIISFMPASRPSDDLITDLAASFGQVGRLLQMRSEQDERSDREVLRPPALVPHVASRTSSVPLPRAAPRASALRKEAARPAAEPAQRSAALPAKRAKVQTAQQAPAPVVAAAPAVVAAPAAAPTAAAASADVEAKSAVPLIRPTQPMPRVQGLD
jgi:hypothetical protein